MGGLGPGIGGLEILVIGLLALIVVGPKDLPVLLRKVGQAVAKARAMASEFRSSFDEMARQSELDELRKEVEALRTGQGAMGTGLVRLGDEANAAFKDIRSELEQTNAIEAPPAAVMLNQPEFPEPATEPVPNPSGLLPAPVRKSRVKARPASGATSIPARKASPQAGSDPVAAPRPRAPRKPKATS